MPRLRDLALLAAVLPLATCARNPAAVVTPIERLDPRTLLVPRPLNVELSRGEFPVTLQTAVHAESELFAPAARTLARHIGLALGHQPLPVTVGGEPAPGGIAFRLQRELRGLGGDGYTLSIRPEGATVHADTAAGAFYAVQTLRQLLPPGWEHEGIRPPRPNARPVTLRAMDVRDQTRFEWRGAMLDVARHFRSVDEVKRFIDLMALYKLNRLHLHLADDQGWRIAINAWPALATVGGSTEVDGGAGGFYTQEQYAALGQYAAERHIVVVPEIDMPGHTNAALASYAELNCDNTARPLYTGTEVGFSALCVEKEVTYKFIDDVVREIAALTPGPYFHIGGDEVKTLTPAQYVAFIERVQQIVHAHGKRVIGWDEIAPATLLPSSIVQHWRPTTTPAQAVAQGAKVIMSIADRAYIDMKYSAATPIGLSWASLIDVRRAYDWDPATVTPGIAEASLLGVEAPLWAETLATMEDVEFLAFPRLAAIAEVAWSRQADRDWNDFRGRLGTQGPRWAALGVNFYRAPEVPWR